jgi:hypothetical protein
MSEQKLSEELNEGTNIAKMLVEHVLFTMGAAGAVIPVLLNDEKYEVSVTHIPVKETET